MKRLVFKICMIGALVCFGMLVLRLAGPKLGERMQRRFEEAPEDWPPKWMYLNITAIRENTERILKMMGEEGADTQAD